MAVNHVAEATGYCRDVVAGKIAACGWTVKACQRQLDDLERAAGGAWDFYFDEKAANRACKFIELMPHVKGRWATKTIVLEPWQKFIVCCVFGWKRLVDGFRRFATVYIEVPRKNAKSTLLAACCLYAMALDGEDGAEVYSAATNKDQAKVVFDIAKKMTERSPEFRSRYGVGVRVGSLLQNSSGSLMKPLAGDGSNALDGLNVHLAAIDELHAHKTRDTYDVLETGTGSRDQPIIWCITTAGSNIAGICYEQRVYLTKILEGVAPDDSYFGVIYTIDEDDDIFAPATWAKANPNFGVSVKPRDMERLARKARETPAAEANFKTKRLDVWVSAMNGAFNMTDWKACADPTLRLEDFEGEECIIAVDLASVLDIAATILSFKRDRRSYYFGRFYLPEKTIQTAKNSQYKGWAKQGHLIKTPGERVDYDIIKDDILNDHDRFDVLEVAVDPWHATNFQTQLLAEEIEAIDVNATVKNFSEPMKELIADTVDGTMVHTGCPVFTWMASNTVCRVDAKDNIFPRKEIFENKIDGIVAAIMCKNRWLFREPDDEGVEIPEGYEVPAL